MIKKKTISSVLVMQSPMHCLLNSNVKVIQLCHVHIVYFWKLCSCHFFFLSFFNKFALLIQLLPIMTYVQQDRRSSYYVVVDDIW